MNSRWRINTQIAYVGSVNRHQIGYTYFNTAPVPGPGAVQPRRLLPQYGDVEKGANAFSSNYNALQALIGRRFRKGLQFQANYTYGRSLRLSIVSRRDKIPEPI